MAKVQILVAALVLVASFRTVEPSDSPSPPDIVWSPSSLPPPTQVSPPPPPPDSPPPPPPDSSPPPPPNSPPPPPPNSPPPPPPNSPPPPPPFFSSPPPPPFSSPPPPPISSPPPPPVSSPPPPPISSPPPPPISSPPPPPISSPPPPPIHSPPPPIRSPPPPIRSPPPPPPVHHPPPPPRYPILTVKPLTVRSDPGIDAKIFLTYSDARGDRKRAGHYQLPPQCRPLTLSQEIRVSKFGPLCVEFSIRRGSQRISLTATIDDWLARRIACKTWKKNSSGDPLYSLDLKLVIKSYPRGKFFEVYSGRNLVAQRRV